VNTPTLHILSRYDLATGEKLPREPHIVIAVSNWTAERMPIDDCIQLYFDDASYPSPKHRLMDRRQAEAIIEYVVAYIGDTSHIVIACENGLFRSTGIAYGLCDAFGWDTSQIHPALVPNSWVRRLVAEVGRKVKV